MAFALDAAVVLIITLCAVIGYVRGFIRYAIKMLGTVVCVILALIISEIAARPIYERFVEPSLQSAVEQRLKDFDINKVIRNELKNIGLEGEITDEQLSTALSDSGSISSSLSDVARQNGADDASAEKVENELEKFFSGGFVEDICAQTNAGGLKGLNLSDGMIYDLVRSLASDDGAKNGAEYITGNIVDPAAVTIVRWVLFVIILLAAESVLSIVFAIARVFDKLPAVTGVNRFFGMLLGIAKGLLYIFIIAAAVSAMVSINEAGDLGLDVSFVDRTYIFRYIYALFDGVI